jgi:hypothetical protein
MDGKRTIEVHVGKPADVLEACAVGTSIPTTLRACPTMNTQFIAFLVLWALVDGADH